MKTTSQPFSELGIPGHNWFIFIIYPFVSGQGRKMLEKKKGSMATGNQQFLTLCFERKKKQNIGLYVCAENYLGNNLDLMQY